MIADPMDLSDDPSYAPFFLSVKIEELLKTALMKNVDAKHFLEYQEALKTDLVELGSEQGIEAVQEYINTELGKFHSA